MPTDKPARKTMDCRHIAAREHPASIKNAGTHAARDAPLLKLPSRTHHHADYLLHVDANAICDIKAIVAPGLSKANRSQSRPLVMTMSAPCRSN